jgi:hypothetical protein
VTSDNLGEQPAARELTKPTRRNGPSKEALAITYLGMHPEWTDAQIAEEVSVNRTTLYRFKHFMDAKIKIGKNREKIPKGIKFGHGEEQVFEAYKDEDEYEDECG